MLPIIKKTALHIWAKPVPTEDPERWPGLGGVLFYADFSDPRDAHGLIQAQDQTLPILVWNHGQWRTHLGLRDIDE